MLVMPAKVEWIIKRNAPDATSASLRGPTMNFTAETQRSQRLFLKSKLLLFLRTPHLCDCPPTRNGCSKD